MVGSNLVKIEHACIMTHMKVDLGLDVFFKVTESHGTDKIQFDIKKYKNTTLKNSPWSVKFVILFYKVYQKCIKSYYAASGWKACINNYCVASRWKVLYFY
jgi:hypothetical protein